MTKEKKVGYSFDDYKNDSLARPRDIGFSNWMKFKKVGDKVQGYIADVFYQPANGVHPVKRGLTLLQSDGKYINVGINRLDFVLAKTDNLTIGDPLTVELTELKDTDKGTPAKILTFYGKHLPENVGKTVKQLDDEDFNGGGTIAPDAPKEDIMPEAPGIDAKDVPFP